MNHAPDTTTTTTTTAADGGNLDSRQRHSHLRP